MNLMISLFGNIVPVVMTLLVFSSLYDDEHIIIASLIIFVYVAIKEWHIETYKKEKAKLQLKLLTKQLILEKEDQEVLENDLSKKDKLITISSICLLILLGIATVNLLAALQ